ncbi:MAG: hypothetical protein ACOYN0_09620 [Phycisphaerales bacterium]
MTRSSAVLGLTLCAGVALGQPCTNVWVTPAPGLDAGGSPGVVQALKAFDGQLFAGGVFGASGQAPLRNAARWNGTSWVSASGLPGPVTDLESYDGGNGLRLYAAGSFRDSASLVDLGVRRWTGSAWESVAGPDGTVTDLFVHNDGSGAKLYACGSFTTTGGVATNRIARFNGASWEAVGSNGGLQNVLPNSMAALSSGTRAGLSVGGYPIANTQNIPRWNGSLWTNDNAGSGFNEVVRCATYANQVYTSLAFSAGVFRAGGSTSWTPVPGFSAFGYTGTVYALHAHAFPTATLLYAGGDFTTIGAAGASPSVIGAFNGTVWSTLQPAGWQANPLTGAGTVRAMTSLPDGRLAFGGDLDGARRVASPPGTPLPAPDLRLNSVGTWDGSNFGALGDGLTAPGVKAICRRVVGGSEQIFIGGSFQSAGTSGIPYLAKYENGDWSQPLPGINGRVRQIHPYQGGLVIVGDFTHIGQTAVPGIVRIDANNTIVPLPTLPLRAVTATTGLFQGVETLFVGTFGANGTASRLFNNTWQTVTTGSVNDIAISPDGSQAVIALTQSNVARAFRYNGASPTEIPFVGILTPSQYQRLAWLPGPSGPVLYMTGYFRVGVVQGNLARLDTNGFVRVSTDTFPVTDLGVFDDSNGPRLLAVTGTQLSSGPASVVRWDGTAWRSMGAFNAAADAFVAYSVNNVPALLVGGEFTEVDGVPVRGIAMFQTCPFCAADLNQDARVDGDDVIEFFARWDANDSRVDFDASGGVDGDDTIAFFDRWDRGC